MITNEITSFLNSFIGAFKSFVSDIFLITIYHLRLILKAFNCSLEHYQCIFQFYTTRFPMSDWQTACCKDWAFKQSLWFKNTYGIPTSLWQAKYANLFVKKKKYLIFSSRFRKSKDNNIRSTQFFIKKSNNLFPNYEYLSQRTLIFCTSRSIFKPKVRTCISRSERGPCRLWFRSNFWLW